MATPEQPQSSGEPKVGDQVGDYRLEAPLGEGGMAQVFKGVGPNGELVAVKLVKTELAAEPIFRRRFDREASVVADVDHPHVVRVLDMGRHGSIPYMAQEFMPGGSLEDKLKRDGKLDVATAVRYAGEIAAGLEAVHKVGLVHRDLKPGNILLDEQGVVKITDFGLVKDLDATALTVPGQALGSMDYMAPEQIRGADVNSQTDVYALGCVVYEFIAGRPPFADRQGMKILWAHLQEEADDPTNERPDVPKDFGRVIGLALQKEPDDRPAGAITFARMLEEAGGGS